jgi:hypothetical protein
MYQGINSARPNITSAASAWATDAGRRILVRPGQRCGKRAAQIQVLPELRMLD